MPTCAQLNVNSNCTAHYYFTGCRDKVTGKVNPLDFEWSCENPCGKEILALDCEVKNGACVDRVVSPATGCFNEPTIECH